MPSSIGDWMLAHAGACEVDAEELESSRLRTRECPLGSGAGYGVPLELGPDGPWGQVRERLPSAGLHTVPQRTAIGLPGMSKDGEPTGCTRPAEA